MSALSCAREIRKALEAEQHPPIAECVIEDWSNEPHRRKGMANNFQRRRLNNFRYGSRRTPSRAEIERRAQLLNRQNHATQSLIDMAKSKYASPLTRFAVSMLRFGLGR